MMVFECLRSVSLEGKRMIDLMKRETCEKQNEKKEERVPPNRMIGCVILMVPLIVL